MIIHQLQATYQVHQDRILLRLNTTTHEEFRLWLTRRMMLGLLPNLTKVTTDLANQHPELASHDSTQHQALANFKKQEALALADFATPYASETPALPIGSTPLLLSTIHMTPLNDGKLHLGFEEAADGDSPARSFSVTMAQPVFHSLLHLLESVLAHTQWGLAPAPAVAAPATDVPDDFTAAAPPVYLN
jgi:hypothetical protein